MKIQGWGIQAAPVSFAGIPVSGDLSSSETVGSRCSEFNDDSPDKHETRLELLKKIRSRIKSGFYNSDAVIDDIGHGFAQALDQSM